MFLFFPTLVLLGTVSLIKACRPVCWKIKMDAGISPTTYNKCSCSSDISNVEDYDFFFSAKVPPCTGQYRSLKFRNATTGVVVLHKAVIKNCVSKDGMKSVEQTEFEKQEREYHYRRQAKIPGRVASISSWLLGFRPSFWRMNSEHHLRFG